MVAVADGMGSRSNARVGARAACRAARDAARLWSPTSSPRLLGLLVELLWRMRIAPLEPNDCASTCLVALRTGDGAWTVGGVGDGLAVYRDPQRGHDVVVGDRGTEFGNSTTALGVGNSPDRWKWKAFRENELGGAVVLASDGVADDLLPERLGGFVEWLVEDVGSLPAPRRACAIKQSLRQWPTPNHLDDKTVAAMWSVPARAHGGE